MNRQIKTIIILFAGFLIPAISTSAIVKGPYLLVPEMHAMTIMWESDKSEEAIVKYGQTNSLGQIIKVQPIDNKEGFYLYRAQISNLEPGNKYMYKVIMKEDSSESYFHTGPVQNTAITFVAIGDSRTGHETFRKIANQINQINPNLIISMGDLVGRGGDFDQWNPHYFGPAVSLINHIPLVSTLGDHETNGDKEGINFFYYFRPCASNTQMWFSYDYGPAHFVSLDYRASNDSLMMAWFEKDMAQSQAKWKFVYLHRPSYNVGGHRSHWGHPAWPALFRKYEVDIVYTGHSHLYERFYPMRPSEQPDTWPVTYITTGGSGAGLYESIAHKSLAFTKSINHLLSIKLSADTLFSTALLPDGKVLDQLLMIKRDGVYDDSYMDLVKSQEEMNMYMIFAPELLVRFNQIPTATEPAQKKLSFNSIGVNEDIKFQMILSEESEKHYRIDPFAGILNKGQNYSDTIRVYLKEPVTIDRRYFDPPLKFNLKFETNTISGTAIGRQSRYYPPKP